MIGDWVMPDKYYMMVCFNSGYSWKIQENDRSLFENSRLMATHPNPNDDGQLFLLALVGDNKYEIVNCQSDLVLEYNSSDEIHLHRGKQSKTQLFTLKKSNVQADRQFFYILPLHRMDKALSLEGMLRLSTFDTEAQTQLFKMQEVNSLTINNSVIIMSSVGEKVLDVPSSSMKAGERIITWDKNGRWNQRWVLQAKGKGFVIRNLFTKMVLDIAGQGTSKGTKIIQWPEHQGINQIWYIEKTVNDQYRFQSALDPSLFLAIRKDSTSNGGQLEVNTENSVSINWKIQGKFPSF